MRKITKLAEEAFEAGINFKLSNTRVENDGNEVRLYLHGNLIAKRNSEGMFITNCGWFSNTTKERLNALTGVSIYQRNYTWYLNDAVWDGKLIKIS